MEKHNMTIHKLIEMIKLKGEPLELKDNVFSIPNGKYGERAIILFEDRYYVTWEILDQIVEKSYLEDLVVFDKEFQARVKYDNLLTEHNGTI
jgi:hypothetical protein